MSTVAAFQQGLEPLIIRCRGRETAVVPLSAYEGAHGPLVMVSVPSADRVLAFTRINDTWRAVRTDGRDPVDAGVHPDVASWLDLIYQTANPEPQE